jgi:primosomal protein N' (replication factor Y)
MVSASPTRIVRKLPTRPPAPQLAAPEGQLGGLGRQRAVSDEAGLLRLGPATDPFELVLGFLAGLIEQGRLEQGSALVLVPGLAYASRLVARLARRQIPAIAEAEGWEAARASWPVVVGTRAAAFAPIPRLAGVIALDVDDSRFHSESAPTWRATAIVAERARREQAPALFVASCPSAVEAQLGAPLTLPPSDEEAGWPTVLVADRRTEDPRHGLFGSHLVDLARQALDNQPEGVALACIVNRTGRARLLACARCDAIARCEHCEAAMALDDELSCTRCGSTRPVICQSCGATKLKLLRLGTAQLAPELGALLGVPVAELTASTSGTEVLEGARGIVGTEAVLHRLRRCSLVCFLDFDHHLLAPRVGAELQALGMVARAGRLVGGRGNPSAGVVLLQTRQVEHPAVIAAQRGAPAEVIEADAALRRELRLAPNRAFALLRGEGAGALAAELGDLEVALLSGGAFAVSAESPTRLADALAAAPRPRERVVVAVEPDSF